MTSCFPIGYWGGISRLLPALGLLSGIPGEALVSELPIVSVDTETTSIDPKEARIVEIAVVGESGTWSRLVNPGVPIPAEAISIHGINDDAVRGHEFFSVGRYDGLLPLAYNARYDREVIRFECERNWLDLPFGDCDWIDPLVWARYLYPKKRSRALGEMCKTLGVNLAEAHRAENDAKAALELWKVMRQCDGVPTTYKELIMKQRYLEKKQAMERRWH